MPDLRILPVALLALVLAACGESPADIQVETERDENPRSLRVISLNAWAIPFVAKDLTDRMARLGPALREIDADVVCLQEMFSVSARGVVKTALGDAYRAAATGAPGGLVVHSRHPVVRSAFTPFPVFPNLPVQERIAGKGLLEVVVETPAGQVRVVTAHLALAFGEENPRSRQLRFLLDHLDALPPLPTVLAADLNTPPVWEGEIPEDYRSILDRGWRPTDPPRRNDEGGWTPPTPTRVGWPRAPEPARVYYPDHILLRDGPATRLELLRFEVTLSTPADAVSDHDLLLADLRLAPR